MKKSVIIALSIATLLILASVIFGIVFFSMKISVTDMINEVFADTDTVTVYNNTTNEYTSVDIDSVKTIILDEVKDLKFTNAIVKITKDGGSTVFYIGNFRKKTIAFYDNAISINNTWYRARGGDELHSRISSKLNELLANK